MRLARKRKVSLNRGASKALAALKKRYGAKRGRSIFYGRASRFGGKGKTPSQKANATFGVGSHKIKRATRKKK